MLTNIALHDDELAGLMTVKIKRILSLFSNLMGVLKA